MDELLMDGECTVDDVFSYCDGARDDMYGAFTACDQRAVDELWGTYLCKDTRCGRSMDYRNRTVASCMCCELFGRLFNLASDVPFVIECGERVGETFIITKRIAGRNGYIDDEMRSTAISFMNDAFSKCCSISPERKVLYVSYGPVSCEVIIGILLTRLIRWHPQTVFAFSCNINTYILKQKSYSLLEKLQSMSETSMIGIVCQLACLLETLSSYHFVHGNPSIGSLVLQPRQISTMMFGVHVECEYALGFEPGDSSSITLGTMRIARGFDEYYKREKLQTNVVSEWVGRRFKASKRGDEMPRSPQNKLLFMINENEISTFLKLRRYGIPLYPCSFDLYCFLVSLYSCKPFKHVIRSSFWEAWSSLWVTRGTTELLESRIGDRESLSFNETVDVLRGVWLRCDAVSTFIDRIPRGRNLSSVLSVESITLPSP